MMILVDLDYLSEGQIFFPGFYMGRDNETQGHCLNNLGSTKVPNTTYQVSRPSVDWFWKRGFLRFLPYMSAVVILVM